VDARLLELGAQKAHHPAVMVVFDNAQLVDAVFQGSLVRLGR
jgi:hypothetical protein